MAINNTLIFRKYFVKAVCFVAIGCLLGFFVQSTVDAGLAKTEVCAGWNDIFSGQINADLLVQGSSRAYVHVSPRMLDEALGVNSYNLAVNGYNFLMQYYRFTVYLQHYEKPKFILQTLDTTTLNRRQNLYQIEQFYPYLANPVIWQATSYYEGFDWIDRFIPLSKYRHSANSILNGILGNCGLIKRSNYKGFVAMDRTWNDDFAQFRMKHRAPYEAIDPVTDRLFDRFCAFCVQQKIKVIFVYTPEYIEAQKLLVNRAEIMGRYANYAARYSIPLLDYSHHEISFDTANFYNSQHLNSRGVALFNPKLANDIRTIILPTQASINARTTK